MKHSRFIIALSLLAVNSFAQDSKNKCKDIYSAAEFYFQNNEYQLAIKKIAAYKICNTNENKKADSLLLKIYETVNNQRIEAIRQKNLADSNAKIADKRRREAETETKKAQSLTLAAIAREQLDKNPTFATRLAELAWKTYPGYSRPLQLQRIISDAFYSPIEKKQLFFQYNFENLNHQTETIFSPDGAKIGAETSDSIFKIWDFNSGNVITTLEGRQKYPINNAAFSPDGTEIAIFSRDSAVKIWNTSTGKLISYFDSIIVSNVDFLSNEKLISATNSGEIDIRDIASHKRIASFYCPGFPKPVLSRDNVKLAAICNSREVNVWNINSDTLVALFYPHDYRTHIESIVFSPNGAKILAGLNDNNAIIWDIFHKDTIILAGHTGAVRSVAFSVDGLRAVTASEDNTAKIWDANFGEMTANLTGHKSMILNAIFSPDGTKVATASGDKTAKIWDVSSGKMTADLIHGNYISDVAFSQKGNKIATKGNNGGFLLWDLKDKKLLSLSGYSGPLRNGIFISNGKKILTISADSTIRVWDATSGEILEDSGIDGNKIIAVFYSPSNKKIAALFIDKTIKILDLTSEKITTELIFKNSNITRIAFSYDDKKIITLSKDSVVVRDLYSKIQPINLPTNIGVINHIFFSPNGKQIVIYSSAGTKIYNLDSQKFITDFMQGTKVIFSLNGQKIITQDNINDRITVRDLNFKVLLKIAVGFDITRVPVLSPDGTILVTIYDNDVATLRETSSGKIISNLIGHKDDVVSSTFSPDGKKIVTTSYDKTAKIWDVASGKLIADLTGHTGYVMSAAFSYDGKKLVTVENDNTAKIWLTTEGIIDWLKTAPIYKLTQKDLDDLGIDFIDVNKIQQ